MLGEVVGILTGQHWETGKVIALTRGRVTARTGRNAFFGIPPTVERLTDGNVLLIRCSLGCRLAGIKSGQVFNILRRQGTNKRHHLRHRAHTAFDFSNLFDQVSLTLAGEIRPDGRQTDSRSTVTGRTGDCLTLACGSITLGEGEAGYPQRNEHGEHDFFHYLTQ